MGGPDPSPNDRLSGLLARVAAGDEAGLSALYDETAPFVYALLLQALGAGGAAEETLVEVYSCAWRRAASFRPGGASALAWLVSTARRCISERGRPADVNHPETAEDAGEAGEFPAYVNAEAARAREALRRLAPEQREALRLTYLHGPGRPPTREARALVGGGLRSYAEMFGGAPAEGRRPAAPLPDEGGARRASRV